MQGINQIYINMKHGNLLITLGIISIAIGLTAISVYHASFDKAIQEWFFRIVLIILGICVASVAFDGSFSAFISKLIGEVSPEIVRTSGIILFFIIFSVSFLISSAVKWTYLVTVIQFIVIGSIFLIILGIIIYLLITSRGGQNG